MKIDTSKARKSSLEVPPDCLELIERLCRCTWSEVLIELKKIDTWTYGKCELYHWVKVLDYFDGILESAAGRIGEHPRASQSWHLRLDNPENEELKELVIWVLHFTTLLIEHSFSRHMYNSVEHLLVLLSSCNLEVVLAVLNLLYMFSKRSNFIIRLKPSMRDALLKCLTYLAESWGGRENGFGLADCCRDNPSYCPSTATTLHYEFYTEEEKSGKSNQVSCIHIENVDKLDRTAAEIMNSLLDVWKVPLDGQMSLFTHVRLAYSFSNYQLRLQCVQARLQSLSILLYNHSFIEIHNLLYTGLLDELVELLELNDPKIIEIKAAALRTLTSIIHLDRNPRSPLKPGSRLNMIIDVTGASLYHGFLPQMVRNCISSLTGARNNELVPLPLATALFSFLYHLSSYEPGSEALVNCGMMESLLKIVNWPGKELEHITFVTRAVRVIDLITNMDMQAFQVHGGMNSFIDRLEMEIKICRTEQPFEIVPTSVVADAELDEEMNKINVDSDSSSHSQPGGSASTSTAVAETTRPTRGKGQQKTCLTQRAALLKSMLNFMKKALQDVTIHQTIRHVMDGSLPSSLKHIISNAEYYGPSLFLLATDVVTAYVFQEPTLLSSLQENGLTDVVLHALLVKDVPATREVLGSLPNVFSALCLNPRGLTSFVRCRPFDKLFKVLISPVYLSAMRNRRSVNGDTATNLGNAMDELMRHQPTLKAEATSAIIRLLEALCRLGTDPRYICWRAQKGGACNESPLPLPLAARVPREEVAGAGAGAAAGGGAGAVGGGGGSSDEEDDDEEEASTSTPSRDHDAAPHETTSSQNASEKTPIALIDYISNVMKFIDAILSNNSTEDHCREFINQGGLDPLLSVLGLPNLPVDYPSTVLASQSVASVCKSILNLTNAPKVMEVALTQLNEVLQTLGPLLAKRESLEGSILLHELATASNLETAIVTPSATPLLHAVAAVNSYVIMFVNVCRTAQTEIRQTALLNWGSELGLKVLNQLCHLYSSSLWESTILLALCSDDASTASRFSREDVERLFPSEMSIVEEENSANTSMESEPMDVDEQPTRPMAKKKIIPPVIQLKYIKPILASSSRLGRGLAELFGLLVKLCVGSPTRTRRAHHQTDTHSNREAGVAARRISKTVAALLIRGIHPDQLPKTPLPKFALTYLICSLGFTTPLMFDDKKLPYHLMLYNFMYADGLDTLFKVLLWALTAGGTVDLNESLENLPGLPDGTDEFLDAWLIFVEKLANPKTVFDMAHFTSGVDLDHIYYTIHLNRLHMLTFMALKKLWGRRVLPTSNWTYWPRIVETMLILFKLVLCGDRVLEKKQKEEEAASVLSSRPGQAGNSEVRRREQQQNHHHHHHHHHQQQQQQPRPEVNVSDLQQLMDMGFLRDHCYEALILTSTMEHATDYLLNNFFPYSARNSQQPSMDTEDEAYFSSAISLDDQAESLGTSSGLNERFRNAAQNSENDPVSQNAGTQDIGAGNASSGNTDVDVPIWKGLPEFWDETHIKDLLDNFSESVVPYCLDILEDIPEYAQHDIVYHMSELIKCSLLRRRTNGKAFAVQVLTSLAKEIIRKMQDLTTKLIPLNKSVTNTEDKDKTELDINTVFISPESSHTASIITLFTLIFEELRIPGARVVHLEDGKILKEAVDLLKLGADILSKWKLLITPRWLASILQFLDLCEKVSDATKRKSTMHKNTTDVWKWFDLSSGKWILYSHSNNRAINEKYWGGYSVAKINSGRRYYNIAFQHMMQTNEESGKARPVMRSFIAKKDLDNAEQADATKGQNGRTSGDHHDDDDDDDDDSYPETLSFGVDFNETRLFDEYFCQPRRNIVPVDGIPEEHIKTLISACVSLLNSTDNKETLQAALVMCVRFTRKFETASYVAEMGVVKTLLSLKSSTSFPGFENLSTILIRHILEEPSTLEVAFEKVLRAKTLQNIPPSYKELYFILRECSAAICRDMSAFKKVSERILRIDIAASSKKSDDDEIRYLMKSIPTNTTNKRKKKPLQKNTEESARKTVYDLLNALVVDCDEKPKNKSKPADDKEQSASMAASHNQGFEQQRSYVNLTEHIVAIAEQQQQQRQMLANHLANIVNGFEIPTDHTFPGQNTSNIDSFVSPMNRSEKERKVRLISKSGILKILSDAVRSYNTIASLITQYSYVGNKNSLVKEDCSAIAFVLDNMLTSDEGMPDPDRPNLARGLIAAVASCNHSPDAQLALVNEVKSALQRALAMKESAKKHQHIIDLVGIVTIMIENCPPVPINSTPLTSSLKLSQFSVNNMVRFMMKKNIVIDLARISHTLDLSSPKMSTTVNAALKPLETLTRIMSCPPTTASKVKTRQSTAAAARDQPGTSTSESTNAQGEDAVEDTDNTDHDMSGPVDEESIDGRHDGITTAMRNELEDLIDRVNSDLANNEDSPMIDNDGDEHNPNRNTTEVLIFDDNSFENAEDILRRMNNHNHNDQRDGSSGEDSDSNSTEDHRMDSNDPHNEDHNDDDDAVDGEDDDGEGGEGEDEDEEEDDEEEEEEEEDEDEEDDDGDHYDNETFEMFDTEDGVLHIPGLDHESDDFLMIEFSEPTNHSTPLMPWISPAFSFPSSLLDEATHENSNGPGGSGRIPPIHPFLMSRQNLVDHRTQRLSRTRRHPMMEGGTGAGDRVPYIGAPHPHPNGHGHGSVTADIITTTLSGNNARVVVMDNGLGIFTNTEEEQISYVDQSGYLLGPSLAATLNNVPTSMHWWNEEAKLLDGDSQADASAVVGFDTTDVFVKHRADEMAERREAMKKLDEQKKKKKPEAEKKSSNQKNDYSGLMDILEASSTSSGTGAAAGGGGGGGSGPPRLAPRTRAATANVLAAAAQEVAQATENLAGSIVDSALNIARSWPSSSPPSSQSQSQRQYHDRSTPEGYYLGRDIIYSQEPSFSPQCTQENSFSPQCNQENSYSPQCTQETLEDRQERSQMDNFDEPTRFTTETTEFEYSAPSPRYEPFSSPGDEHTERVEIPILLDNQSDDQVEERPLLASNTTPVESNVIRLRRRQITISPRQSNSRSSQGESTTQESVSSQASTIILPRTRPDVVCQRPHAPTPAELRQLLADQREASRQARQAICIEWSSPHDQETPNQQQQQQQQTATESAPSSSRELAQPSELDSEGNQVMQDAVDNSEHGQTLRSTLSSPTSTDDGFSVSQLMPPESETFGEMVTVESGDVEDPLGLIPGSVPFPAQTDPDDGFFRVNRYESGQNEENSNASSPGQSPFNSRNFQQDNAAARMSTWLDSQISNSGAACSTPVTSQGTQENSSQDRTNTVLPAVPDNSAEVEQSSNNASSNLPDIPEGVDPSFLEALPEDMRAEVIQEHLRLQRMSARAEAGAGGVASTSAESSSSGSGSGSTQAANLEVNADFLNALPPNIQQEVLAQQRLEQQRQQAALANPNEPMDPTAFFQDLPANLRSSILADMEESQISVLPPELAAEAQNLRREWEARNRQLVQERFLNHVTNSSTTLSSILRNTGSRNMARQGGTQRYTIQGLPQRSQHWSGWALRQHQTAGGGTGGGAGGGGVKPNMRTRGRQILDYDSICCLLVLLFVDDSKLNTVRLHRVFRNLCYHAPTRDWIIKALLSIMEKSNEGVDSMEKTSNAGPSTHRSSKRIAARIQTVAIEQQALINIASKPAESNSWLNISMDAALGCRATVFHVIKTPGRRTGIITINYQAAPFVYRHALDLLISLAKTFPNSFVPSVTQSSSEAKPSSHNQSKKNKDGPIFWEILVRLDASFNSKKGKNTQKCITINQEIEHCSLDSAPFGQLLKMLASPVVRKSSPLMNKLLRLLSLVSSGLQASKEHETTQQVLSEDTLRHLSLVSDVLTSITCTEEGLEDATALLLNMSVKLKPIREAILKMLLDGATKMAERMNKEIETLLKEVVASLNNAAESEEKNDNNRSTSGKGILRNRFTKDTVVVSAPKKVKTGQDLQLSSMAPLISKTSSQSSFLRILKVIVQIRDSIRSVESKNKETDEENDEDDDDDDDDDEELFLLEVRGDNERQGGSKSDKNAKKKMPPLSELLKLDHLWSTLSRCLRQLDKTQDSHAVLVLQPAVEAFFIVHASSAETLARPNGNSPGPSQESSSQQQSQSSSGSSASSRVVSNELAAPPPLSPLPTDNHDADSFPQAQSTQHKFLKFAETHRTVLNQILRQCNTPLVDGPFAVLVNHTRVLDFDVKTRYFRSELERADDANRREELAVHVKRNHVFEDSFRELHRRPPEEWKNRFYIVFEGEEGQDAGGLLREWYMIISREIFNPMYALFSTSSADKVTYTINTSSHYNNNHLCYFKFVGRVIAKAIFDNKLLECYFTRSFYKHILGIPVKYTDMESEDYTFYQGLVYLMEHHISSLGYDVTFSTEVQEFGVTSVRDLLPNGRNIPVTEENKIDYIRLVCQMKMTGAIRQQLDAFLEGFYDIIPNRLISIFNEQELELLISGLPNVDIDDLKANTEYYKYQPNSLQIQWFWRALREFNQAERAKFLQFVTGTSKVPLQGFSALEGMNGIQKFQIHRDERSTDRLPSAHTCFNQLDLPVYETYTKLRTYLLKAIHECSEGFGFA